MLKIVVDRRAGMGKCARKGDTLSLWKDMRVFSTGEHVKNFLRGIADMEALLPEVEKTNDSSQDGSWLVSPNQGSQGSEQPWCLLLSSGVPHSG